MKKTIFILVTTCCVMLFHPSLAQVTVNHDYSMTVENPETPAQRLRLTSSGLSLINSSNIFNVSHINDYVSLRYNNNLNSELCFYENSLIYGKRTGIKTLFNPGSIRFYTNYLNYFDISGNTNGFSFNLDNSVYKDFSLRSDGSFIIGDKNYDFGDDSTPEWQSVKMALVNNTNDVGFYLKHKTPYTQNPFSAALVVDVGANAGGDAVWIRSGNDLPFFISGSGRVICSDLLITSDINTKKDIYTIENALDKVMKLRGVSYYSIYDEKFTGSREEYAASLLNNTNEDSLNNAITIDIAKQLDAEKNRRRIGVIAQEVENIVPEVVRTKHDGTKAVAYPEMVGLLIQAMKEQQIIIEELQTRLEVLERR